MYGNYVVREYNILQGSTDVSEVSKGGSTDTGTVQLIAVFDNVQRT